MSDLRTTRTHGPPTQSRVDRIEDKTLRLVKDLNDKSNRSGQWTERRAKANYSAKPWDLILADPSAGAFTILLPDPKKCVGAEVKVKNTTSSANQISVAALVGVVDGFVVAMNTAYAQKTFRAATDGWWSV
jgi:hypothetical protein